MFRLSTPLAFSSLLTRTICFPRNIASSCFQTSASSSLLRPATANMMTTMTMMPPVATPQLAEASREFSKRFGRYGFGNKRKKMSGKFRKRYHVVFANNRKRKFRKQLGTSRMI